MLLLRRHQLLHDRDQLYQHRLLNSGSILLPSMRRPRMTRISRSFLLKFILTVAALAVAMHVGVLGDVPRAEAQVQSCSNTECHGWAMCRYMPRSNCALFAREGGCTATRCP